MAVPLMDEMIRHLLLISAGGIMLISTSGQVHPSPPLISSTAYKQPDFFFSLSISLDFIAGHDWRTFSAPLDSDVTDLPDTSTYLPCVFCGGDSMLDPNGKLCV